MKRYITNSSTDIFAKEESRGVFWVIDGELHAFPYSNDAQYGVAKSGLTYNHERLWDYVKPKKCNKSFTYYPRGRVDFDNQGRPIIYMNPNIDKSMIPNIKVEFGLRSEPKIMYDNSQHYKCHLDDGYAG